MKALFFSGLFFLIVTLVMVFYPQKSEVIISKQSISVEVANTPSKRQQGLSGRTALPHQTGMLFSFPEKSIYSFWNNDTLIPLDLYWIDNGIVVHEGTLPIDQGDNVTLIPPVAAEFVLEVPRGQFKGQSLLGQKVMLRHIPTHVE
jgi:uncharacterized membrane protein (UPF0127 family)